MILKLFKNTKLDNDYIYIKYRDMNEKIHKIIEIVDDTIPFVLGKLRGARHKILCEDILYFESVDKVVFVYTKDEVYKTTYSLKELENNLSSQSFIRISKSMIVNLYKVEEIKADINMRLQVLLSNKEVVTITRHYRDDFFQAIEKMTVQGGK